LKSHLHPEVSRHQSSRDGRENREIKSAPPVESEARPSRLRIIRSLDDWRDDTLLAALAAELLKDGIVVEEITSWAMKLMAPLGVLTKKSPNEKQWKDILFGRKMAQGVGALDIGQTVVVKNAAVISVEAIEGTDKAIRRAGELGFPNGVVVKMAKPEQDMRFDVPGVGSSTIAHDSGKGTCAGR
jgi:DUF1009 family protein